MSLRGQVLAIKSIDIDARITDTAITRYPSTIDGQSIINCIKMIYGALTKYLFTSSIASAGITGECKR